MKHISEQDGKLLTRCYNLPPLTPNLKEWRRKPSRQAEWLYIVLDYLAYEPWLSDDDARAWLAEELHQVKIETNRAPYPPPFDLPDPFVNIRNGRSSNSKCRQIWWARKRDHKGRVKNQIHWLTSLVKCIGAIMDLDPKWQSSLKKMLAVYKNTDCGCNPPPQPIARPLRSGADLELYL